MIDLHSHILPGIDDGAREIEESLALAKQSVNAGVTHMLCTPHINPGTFDNTSAIIYSTFENMVNAIQDSSIGLKLHYAAEVRLTVDIIEWVNRESLLYIGTYEGRRALLLELPHSHIPAGTDNLIRWLLKNGVQPIIPHPERNREIIDNYDKALWLSNLGCRFQMTAGSLTGRFKDGVKSVAWQMLEDKLISYVASDLHSMKRRPNDMGFAFEKVEQTFGSSMADELFFETPRLITSETEWL